MNRPYKSPKVRNNISWHKSFVIVDSGVVRIQIGEFIDANPASYCGGCDYGIDRKSPSSTRCKLFNTEREVVQNPDYDILYKVRVRCLECIEAEEMHKQYGKLVE